MGGTTHSICWRASMASAPARVSISSAPRSCRGLRRIAHGRDAAHVFPPHLTQGAAMAAEDAFVLAKLMLDEDMPIEGRLMTYSQQRYARSAFVYAFAHQWLEDEQSVRTAEDLETARKE